MACHAHMFWAHCTSNDTAIQDRLNCNQLHQEKAAIIDRFNGVVVRKGLIVFTTSCRMD